VPTAVVADAGGVVVNKEQRSTQERLVWQMALLMRDRAFAWKNDKEDAILADSINRASKALYEFHERMILPAKPKRERKAKL
jgi:hypothetical protein